MNKRMKWGSFVTGGAIAVLVLSGTSMAKAGIAGSAHDFSTKTWNAGGNGTLCGVCHVAHNAKTPQLIPLWSHETSSDAGYTMYTSVTFNASGTISAAPSGPSKVCLSCHDGTVAVDSFGGVTNGGTYVTTGLLSKDLSNDHPISFTYDSTLVTADGYLHEPTTQTVPGMGARTVSQVMLTGGKMECSSCHDVHRQKGTSAADSTLLIVGGPLYQGSKLCLTCHNK